MSVLIEGMQVPKSCAECQLLEGDKMDGLCHGANKWLDDDFFRWYGYDEEDIDDSKPLNCPLVEVPPHGRLIDADKLLDEAKRISGPMTGDGWDNWGVYALIERQPAIIPAEEET